MNGPRFLTRIESALVSRAAERWLRLRDVEVNPAEQALELLTHSTLRDSQCEQKNIAGLGWTVEVLFDGADAPVELMLVHPEVADMSLRRASVLSAIGLAFIGRAVGAVARVPLCGGGSVRAKLVSARPSRAFLQPSKLEAASNVC